MFFWRLDFKQIVRLGSCSCLLHLFPADIREVGLRSAVHAAHAWSLMIALSNHLAPCCRGVWRERGGKMKAEINEVSGSFLLPGHCPEEADCGRHTFINCGVQLLTDMRPGLI